VGGENQQTSLNSSTGYSVEAECTGKPAYLEPNSNSMQKPIGGRSRIGCTVNQKHAAKTQKTTNTTSQPIYRGGISSAEHNSTRYEEKIKSTKPTQKACKKKGR
jgi:hypothetical protein